MKLSWLAVFCCKEILTTLLLFLRILKLYYPSLHFISAFSLVVLFFQYGICLLLLTLCVPCIFPFYSQLIYSQYILITFHHTSTILFTQIIYSVTVTKALSHVLCLYFVLFILFS